MPEQDWRTAVKRAWIIANSNVGDDVLGNEVMSFDTVIREGHVSELEVTDNPIETGAVVSDHAFMKPATLEFEGAVGDVWLYGKDQNGNPVTDLFQSSTSRAAVAFARLLGLQRIAEPFSVQTGLKLYQNMVITSLSAEQDKDTAAILFFRAHLREVIRVSTRTVVYPPRKDGKAHRQASKRGSGGEKKGTPPTRTECDSTTMSCMANKTGAKKVSEKIFVVANELLEAFK